MKILIAENDINSRVVLERALMSQGYTVESAGDGVQALEKAALSPPDMIISDIPMPEIDGFELCRRVKTDERLRSIPFVFYTATCTDMKDQDLAMSLGASRFLIKPMEQTAFFDAIRRVIEEHEERHLPVPDRPMSGIEELDRVQVEVLARKLDKKVRELEEERKAFHGVHQDWEAIFQAIGHPAMILDPQFSVLAVNRAALQAVEAGSVEELIGRKCHEIFHNAPEPPKGCPMTKMLASTKLEENEMDVEALGGIFHVSCTPVLDDNGSIQKIIHIAIDVTGQRRAEEDLRLKESRLSSLLELSQMTNQPVNKLTEFTLEKAVELTGSAIGYMAFLNEDETVLTMHPWSTQAMGECRLQEKPLVYPVHTTGLWGEAVRLRKPIITNDYRAPNRFKKGYPEGHVHVKRHMNIPLFDNGKIVLVAGVGNKVGPYDDSDVQQLTLLMDGMWKIMKRKQTEDALRASEEKYHSVMENASDAILLADMDGNLLEVNRKAAELLGYTKEELVTMGYTMIHPAEEVRRTTDAFAEIILKGFTYMRDGVVVRKDGETVPVDITGSLMAFGDRLVVQCIYRDITERKRAERERMKIEAQLFQARKMEAVGTLAGGIAHDFNNLLMGILGYTSLMLMKTDRSHPFYEKLKIIEKQVESGTDLTKQLLGFARGGKYEVKPVDINSIVIGTSKVFGHTKKEITVHRKLQENLHSVDADKGQIEQMLLNLYVNAWQAMPSGGDLYLETRDAMLDEQFCRPFDTKAGAYVEISVTDTGVGIEPEMQQRIFEPFFTTKDMARGTGLGLASVYGIVKNHGGFVTVYSEKGRGSRFTVYLPASEKEVPKEAETEEKIVCGHETILLVDDEEANIESLKEVLEGLGYKMLTARTGAKTIELYERHSKDIHLVILDMIMPGMSGREIFQRLRELNPEVKVLLSSGYSIDGEASKILALGCSGFIQKPFRVMDLSQKIREVLDS